MEIYYWLLAPEGARKDYGYYCRKIDLYLRYDRRAFKKRANNHQAQYPDEKEYSDEKF